MRLSPKQKAELIEHIKQLVATEKVIQQGFSKFNEEVAFIKSLSENS